MSGGVGAPTQQGGGGALVEIPDAPGFKVDRRIVGDVDQLIKKYGLKVTAAYAPTGHAAGGEHPLGLAIDAVPGPGSSWAKLDELATYAKAHPETFRWVGWNGDAGHGDPQHAGANAHIHLSWATGSGGVPGAVKPLTGIDTGVSVPNPLDIPGKVVGAIVDQIGQQGGKLLLQVALIVGGSIVALVGFARATGVHPVHAAGTAAAAVATDGASLAARKAVKK